MAPEVTGGVRSTGRHDRRAVTRAVVGAAWVWCAAAVAAGVLSGHPAWGAVLVAAPVAASAVASGLATAALAAAATGGALGLTFVGGGAASARLLIVVGVAAGSGMAVVVALIRARDEADLVDAERAGERERLRRRDTEERSRLHRLAAALASCSSAGEVADTTFDSLRNETGAAAALLGLLEGDHDDGTVRFLRAFGYRPDLLERWPTAPLAPDLPATAVMRSREAIFAGRAEEFAERWPAVAGDVTASGFGALCVLPLLASASPVGFLTVSWADRRAFTEDDQRFLEALASQCAQAVERARLSDEERRARRRLAFLGDVTRLLSSSLELSSVISQLVDLVVGSMADACVVLVPSDGLLRRRALAGRSRRATAVAAQVAEWRSGDGHTDEGSVVAAAWHGAASAEAVVPLPDDPGPGAHVLALPLTVAGERLGVMVFVSGLDCPAFDAEDASLAVEVAARASTALDNATRYEHERDTAAMLQRAVLPDRMPAVEGVTLDAVYRAGTAGAQVGGDWFDAVPLDDGRVLVSVGDVMGKGAAAAVLMSQARTAVRAYGVVDPRPASVLARLDRLVATFGETRLVTAVVGVLEPATGRVVLASAGHPPPVVVGPGRCQVVGGGRHRILGVTGAAPPGTVPDDWAGRYGWRGAGGVPSFGGPVGGDSGVPARGGPDAGDDEVTVVLGPRDTLVLYSDGLIERRGETISDGVARLSTVAADCLETEPWWDGSAACLVETLVGDAADDDVVVLTVATPGVPAGDGDGGPGASWIVLPADRSSAPATRRWLRARLAGAVSAGDVPREVCDRAELLAAELVANAVLHARTDVGVGVRVDAGVVHVEVTDQSPVLPTVKRFGPEASTGRGLLLLDELARVWGVEGRSAGKVVWFEVGPAADDRPAATRKGRGTGTLRATAATAATAATGATAAPGATGAPGAAGAGPGGDGRTVALANVPVAVALESAAHYDGLERELQLPSLGPARRAGDRPGPAVHAALREAATAGGVVTDALAPAVARWAEASAEGLDSVDVELWVSLDAGDACRRVNAALDEIEEWSRQGQLLAVPAQPPVVAFRRWLLGQVAAQCAGDPAEPWSEALSSPPVPEG